MKPAKRESFERLERALTRTGYFSVAGSEREQFLGGDVSALWRVPRCADSVADPMNHLDVASGFLGCQAALNGIGVRASIRDDGGGAISVDGMPVSLPDVEETAGAATRALLAELDALCAEAGVPERAYYAEVSDGVVLLLTPAMLDALTETDLLPTWQKPWKDQEPEPPPPDRWLWLERSPLGCVAVLGLLVLCVALMIGGLGLFVWLLRLALK